MILFGYYTFLIRAYMLHELGIEVDEQSKHWQIEVRQKCFHIFWIPLFSLGKVYALRSDGKLYNLPADLEQTIRHTMEHRTPWYTYIGLIAIVASVCFVTLKGKYDDYQRKTYAEDRAKSITAILQHPQIGDAYTLTTSAMRDEFTAQVSAVEGDSIRLKLVKHSIGNEPIMVRGMQAYPIQDQSVEPQWIAKQELQDAETLTTNVLQDSLQLYMPSQGGAVPFALYRLDRKGQAYY